MVVQVPGFALNNKPSSTTSKYISPTLKLKEDVVVDSLQLHQDKSTSSSRANCREDLFSQLDWMLKNQL